jgi:hypothetical protein
LSAFGRVNLLAKKYYLQQAIALKQGNLVAGAGIDKTTLVDKRAGGSGGAAAISVFESGSPAPGGAVIQDLTVDCAFNETWSQRYASRQAIALQGAAITVRRVKAIKFGSGSAGSPCKVISVEVSQANDPLALIEDCLITSPGNNQAVSYPDSPPPLICFYVGAPSGGVGGWMGRGGQVRANRILDLAYTGASGNQRSPVRGVMFAGCSGLAVVDNEFVNLAGACVYAETGIDENVLVDGNRFLTVNVGVYVGDASGGANHTSTGARISSNLIVLGTNSQIWQGLYGVWCNVLNAGSAVMGCAAERNHIQGSTVGSTVPVGVNLYCASNSANSRFRVEDNTLEVPDPVSSGGFNVPYENAVVFGPQSQYLPAQVLVHGNRNLAGTDLRLKLIEATSVWWGPASTRLARFQAPAFDGRVGLATEDFVGRLDTGFALGWTQATSGDGEILAQTGEAGHPGIAKVVVYSSSGSSAMLKYGNNAVVFGPSSAPPPLVHVAEFAVKRTYFANAQERYECRLGFLDAAAANGVFFKIGDDNVIRATCYNGGATLSVAGPTDSGPAWHVYRIEVDRVSPASNYLQARFFVDGTYLGQISNDASNTYIPTTTALLLAFRSGWQAGTAQNKGLSVDYFQHQVTPT